MDSKLFAAVIGGALLGALLMWRWMKENTTPELPDEERLAWLQRLSTIGQMMSGVVHEVRTPLNTVILTVEHIQRVIDKGGDPKEYLMTAAREADRALEILSDILDFAKPSPLDLKPVELYPRLMAALEPLKIRFRELGVETSVNTPPELMVMVSERHFHQVLTILLINALDAMPYGGRLEIRAEKNGPKAWVQLTDTGVGIEPQVLSRLFQPFSTSRADSGGTGLGLNVARWIMNKHGGDVAISSPGIGKGTTVTLTLQGL